MAPVNIRQYFVIGFETPQPLGKQPADAKGHMSMIGYFTENPNVRHSKTIAEHLDSISIRRMNLPGKKLKRMGRFQATVLDDPTGELTAAKDELYAALKADGYICVKPEYYESGGDYKPHVSADPAERLEAPRESFELNNLSVTESRFTQHYRFLGSEILHTRVF